MSDQANDSRYVDRAGKPLALDIGSARAAGTRACQYGEPYASNPYRRIGHPKLAEAWSLAWKSEADILGIVAPIPRNYGARRHAGHCGAKNRIWRRGNGVGATNPDPVSDEFLRDLVEDPGAAVRPGWEDARAAKHGMDLSVDLAREVLALREVVRLFADREVELHEEPDSPFATDWVLVDLARTLLPEART
jgi:hypothetical protein